MKELGSHLGFPEVSIQAGKVEINDLPLGSVKNFLLLLREKELFQIAVYGGAVRNLLIDRQDLTRDLDVVCLPTRDPSLKSLSGPELYEAINELLAQIPSRFNNLPIDTNLMALLADGRLLSDPLLPTLTINCLGITPDGEILDFACGMDDLKSRKANFTQDNVHRLQQEVIPAFLNRAKFIEAHVAHRWYKLHLPQNKLELYAKSRVAKSLVYLLTLSSLAGLTFDGEVRKEIRFFFEELPISQKIEWRDKAFQQITSLCQTLSEGEKQTTLQFLKSFGVDNLLGNEAILGSVFRRFIRRFSPR